MRHCNVDLPLRPGHKADHRIAVGWTKRGGREGGRDAIEFPCVCPEPVLTNHPFLRQETGWKSPLRIRIRIVYAPGNGRYPTEHSLIFAWLSAGIRAAPRRRVSSDTASTSISGSSQMLPPSTTDPLGRCNMWTPSAGETTIVLTVPGGSGSVWTSSPVRKRDSLFLNFPYVRPKPVLVKRSFLV